MSDELLTASETSQWIKKPETTLSQWRYQGRGPSYLKLEGGHVRYRRSDVEAWLTSCEQKAG
jgi:predicted DNA-binding transcriptional regulator AlpA